MLYRYKKDKSNSLVMSTYHLEDKDLSLKSKGLLSVMLTLPDDWSFSVLNLCSICKESKKAIKSALKELKDKKYMTIRRARGARGKYKYIYDIYEKPYD